MFCFFKERFKYWSLKRSSDIGCSSFEDSFTASDSAEVVFYGGLMLELIGICLVTSDVGEDELLHPPGL